MPTADIIRLQICLEFHFGFEPKPFKIHIFSVQVKTILLVLFEMPFQHCSEFVSGGIPLICDITMSRNVLQTHNVLMADSVDGVGKFVA